MKLTKKLVSRICKELYIQEKTKKILEKGHEQVIHRRGKPTRDAWVAQSVECLTLSSGPDFRVLSSSPMLGSTLDSMLDVEPI